MNKQGNILELVQLLPLKSPLSVTEADLHIQDL